MATKLKCPGKKCGKVWEYRGERIDNYVCCPTCHTSVHVIKNAVEQDIEKEEWKNMTELKNISVFARFTLSLLKGVGIVFGLYMVVLVPLAVFGGWGIALTLGLTLGIGIFIQQQEKQ
jgi:hypothetical protein